MSTPSTNDAGLGGGGGAGRPPRSDSAGNEGEIATSNSSGKAERSGSLSHAAVFDRPPPPPSSTSADRGVSSAT
eukprot:CAMPEP_0185805764 /NCGR_PEP_ID=MMETSP1322-20130828/4056_1 /TAXON_ID=265543 /ORGANISM="Minutocellus polymorphus, Strain RCC2270" /LENGTH=73 /DNA_ID=CAMNT_0028501819 /DNA_START=10 /DNA_END=227 /DNA_ORIENTATION=+